MVAGSPAEACGIGRGHALRRVDDYSVAGRSIDDIVALITGPAGTAVAVTLLDPAGREYTRRMVRSLSFDEEEEDDDDDSDDGFELFGSVVSSVPAAPPGRSGAAAAAGPVPGPWAHGAVETSLETLRSHAGEVGTREAGELAVLESMNAELRLLARRGAALQAALDAAEAELGRARGDIAGLRAENLALATTADALRFEAEELSEQLAAADVGATRAPGRERAAQGGLQRSPSVEAAAAAAAAEATAAAAEATARAAKAERELEAARGELKRTTECLMLATEGMRASSGGEAAAAARAAGLWEAIVAIGDEVTVLEHITSRTDAAAAAAAASVAALQAELDRERAERERERTERERERMEWEMEREQGRAAVEREQDRGVALRAALREATGAAASFARKAEVRAAEAEAAAAAAQEALESAGQACLLKLQHFVSLAARSRAQTAVLPVAVAVHYDAPAAGDEDLDTDLAADVCSALELPPSSVAVVCRRSVVGGGTVATVVVARPPDCPLRPDSHCRSDDRPASHDPPPTSTPSPPPPPMRVGRVLAQSLADQVRAGAEGGSAFAATPTGRRARFVEVLGPVAEPLCAALAAARREASDNGIDDAAAAGAVASAILAAGDTSSVRGVRVALQTLARSLGAAERREAVDAAAADRLLRGVEARAHAAGLAVVAAAEAASEAAATGRWRRLGFV